MPMRLRIGRDRLNLELARHLLYLFGTIVLDQSSMESLIDVPSSRMRPIIRK